MPITRGKRYSITTNFTTVTVCDISPDCGKRGIMARIRSAVISALVCLGSVTGVTWANSPLAGASVPIHTSNLVTAPLPSDAQQNVPENFQVNGVSCTAPGNCVAVGGFQFGNTSTVWMPFIDVEVAGVWQPSFQSTLPSSAAPNAQGSLSGVSCSSAGSCVAVGVLSGFLPSGNQEPFAVTETAGVWSAASYVAVPADGVSGQLAAVNCITVGTCLAVGNYQTGTAPQSLPFSIPFNAGTWGTAVTIALPSDRRSGNANGQLTTVACASESDCVAGGFYTSNQGQTALMANGTAASLTNATSVSLGSTIDATKATNLTGVSCVSSGSCTIVGNGVLVTGGSGAVAVSESGGIWGAVTSLPLASVSGISCAAVSTCVAVGSTNAYPTSTADVVVGSSGNWGAASDVALPTSPAPYSGTSGSAISCASASDCAVALAANGNSSNAFVAQWAGGSLSTATPLTAPTTVGRHQSASFTTTTCVSDSICLAAGEYSNLQGSSNVVVESVNDGNVVAQTTVVANQAPSSIKHLSLSCFDATDCVLILDILTGIAERTDAYVETNGMWSGSTIATGIGLRSISCVLNSSYCLAVGWNPTTNRAYSDEYSAGTWGGPVLVPFTLNGHAVGDQFNAVDCTAVGECKALLLVGSLRAAVANYLYAYSSSAWTSVTYWGYSAQGISSLVLSALSCESSSTCAVGGSDAYGAVTALIGSTFGRGLSDPVLPTGYSFGQISSIACRGSQCTYVGSALSGVFNVPMTFSESLPPTNPGTSLHATILATPNSAPFGWLFSVACGPSGSGCLGAGAYNPVTPNDLTRPMLSWSSGVSAAPTVTSVTPGTRSAHITLSAPSSDGGSPVTSYNYYYSLNGATPVLIGNSTSTTYDAQNLPNGATLAITATAVNAAGESLASAAVTTRLPSAPSIPTGLIAVGAGTTVTLTWGVATSSAGPITGYTAYLVTSSAAVGTTTGAISCTTTSTKCVFSKLSPNANYFAWVVASNSSGSSASASVMTKTTPKAAPAPTAVRSLVAKVAVRSASLTWKAPAQVGIGIDHYTVCIVTGSTCTPFTTTNSTTTTVVVTGLTYLTKYTIEVVAVEVNGLTSPAAKLAIKTTI